MVQQSSGGRSDMVFYGVYYSLAFSHTLSWSSKSWREKKQTLEKNCVHFLLIFALNFKFYFQLFFINFFFRYINKYIGCDNKKKITTTEKKRAA